VAAKRGPLGHVFAGAKPWSFGLMAALVLSSSPHTKRSITKSGFVRYLSSGWCTRNLASNLFQFPHGRLLQMRIEKLEPDKLVVWNRSSHTTSTQDVLRR
jgi:hypothetical protein